MRRPSRVPPARARAGIPRANASSRCGCASQRAQPTRPRARAASWRAFALGVVDELEIRNEMLVGVVPFVGLANPEQRRWVYSREHERRVARRQESAALAH